MKNYHTHTKRCGHAKGTDEEYVIAAIEGGFDELGFSDHAPMLFPKNLNYYSTYRIKPWDAQDYTQSIKELKEKYRDKILIHCGFELEYYPNLFKDEVEYLKSIGAEYFILGQHFTLDEYQNGAFYCGHETDSHEIFEQYLKQCIEGLETEKFTYLAHPDLINFTGDRDYYAEKMQKFCKRLKELGYPIEFNLLGFEEKRQYPNETFWRIAAEEKNRVIIGVDAHRPEALKNNELYNNAINYLSNFGITPIKEAELMKI